MSREATTEEYKLLADLASKATTAASDAIETILEDADIAIGPGGMFTIALALVQWSLAGCAITAQEKSQGPEEDKKIMLFLSLAIGMQDIEQAKIWYHQITGEAAPTINFLIDTFQQ